MLKKSPNGLKAGGEWWVTHTDCCQGDESFKTPGEPNMKLQVSNQEFFPKPNQVLLLNKPNQTVAALKCKPGVQKGILA